MASKAKDFVYAITVENIGATTWDFQQYSVCATNKASNQPAHMCSLIRLLTY